VLFVQSTDYRSQTTAIGDSFMIQLNLLPDVKLAFIKARRTKYLVLMSAIVAAGISLAIMIVLLLAVNVLQKNHLSRVNDDIKKHTGELQKTPNLSKILTVQNQLKSLPGLYSQSPVTSRLFGYLSQIVPAQVNITGLDVDFVLHTIQFTGNADTLDTVNVFADTLKFTTFSTQKDSSKTDAKNAFSDVVLNGFARNTTNATYTIKANFDQTIFNIAESPQLTVPPNKITTRSQTDQPSTSLFDASTNQEAP